MCNLFAVRHNARYDCFFKCVFGFIFQQIRLLVHAFDFKNIDCIDDTRGYRKRHICTCRKILQFVNILLCKCKDASAKIVKFVLHIRSSSAEVGFMLHIMKMT